MLLKLSEATATRRRWYFACVDDTDGKTAETGLTFAAGELQISKNGAAFANAAGTATEQTDGLYSYEATAGELDTLGALAFKVEKTGVRMVLMHAAQVVAFDPYDAVRQGLTALPNANAEAAGGLYTRGSGAGQIAQDANGRIDTRTAAMAADVVTAAAVATGAIDADAIADNAIDAGAIAADAITAAKIATGAIDADAIAAGAITAAKFAAGAIDNAAIATDAIGGDELAASAITKIQANMATSAQVDTLEASAASLATAVADVPTNGELATALAPLALSTQVDTVEASLSTLTTAVADVPTNAELATALDPIATAVELTAAVAPLALSAQVDTVEASLATLATAVGDVPTNAELGTALDPIATTAELAAAVDPLATTAELVMVATDILAAIAGLVIPTANQVRDAVWNAVSQVGETAADALRLAADFAAGAGTLPAGDGAYVIRDRANVKDRIAGTIAAAVRAVTTRDGT